MPVFFALNSGVTRWGAFLTFMKALVMSTETPIWIFLGPRFSFRSEGSENIWLVYPPRDPPPPQKSVDVRAGAAPVDMDTTGSSAEYTSNDSTTATDEDLSQNSYVQVEGGFLAGLSLGFVPFAGMGHQLLDAADVLDHGTTASRRGLAVGQIFGGIVTLVGGVTGQVLGGIATTTGIGAALGVPAIAVSTAFVTGGLANMGAGFRGLMTTGSGSGGPQAMAPAPKGRTFQTYTKTNPSTGQVYSGRTSGTGTPAQNVARRDVGHHKNAEGYGPARLDKSSTNRAAIRGREQQLIDAKGGAQSAGGTSGNEINGISDSNLNREVYLEAAEREFGR
jgi:hypothetical protein